MDPIAKTPIARIVMAAAMAITLLLVALHGHAPTAAHAETGSLHAESVSAQGGVSAQASSLAQFDGSVSGANIWVSESEEAFYYLQKLESSSWGACGLRRYDLRSGSSSDLYTFESRPTCYFARDKLYFTQSAHYVGSYWNDLERVEGHVSCIDCANGGALAKLFSLDEGFSPSHIGVDNAGRIYLQDWNDQISVRDAQGTVVASGQGASDMQGFLGFDSESGNFFYQGSTNWRYWGYDHDMSCLKMGNLSGSEVTVSDQCITIFYQSYFFEHYGNAQMFGGRYLADLSTFNSETLSIIDSRKASLSDIGESTTTIDMLTGRPSVTGVALPAAAVAFQAQTFDSEYSDDVDESSVGVRAAYLAQQGLFLVATEKGRATLYSNTGAERGSLEFTHGIYSLMATSSSVVALEKEGDAFYVETVPATLPTSISISGPTSLTAGDSPDYAISFDGDITPTAKVTSSNPAILSIDDRSRASAWKKGSVTLTARTNTGLSASCQVTVKAKSTKRKYAKMTTLKGKKIHNWNANDYPTWSAPVKSYLVETTKGLMRVQENGKKVAIWYYNAKSKVTSKKTVKLPLPLFGGFFADSHGYYLVTGDQNKAESNDATVMRVTRFDSKWKKTASVDVKGANTYAPFDAGSLRMAQDGDRLFIHTCHEMYANDDDGLHHQANMTFVIDENTMEVEDSSYKVNNLSGGYVSHSFNQFARVKDGVLYRLDHGDAYPRALVLTVTPTSGAIDSPTEYATIAEFKGSIGANYTGASAGGLEISDSSALVAWNKDRSSNGSVRNVMLSSLDFESGKVTTKKITNFKKGSKTTCLTPQLVKIDDRHFMLMWSQRNSKTGRIVSRFALVDHTGAVQGSIVKKKLALSDCQPIVLSDGTVAWFASTDKKTRLYAIDPFNLKKMGNDKLGKTN